MSATEQERTEEATPKRKQEAAREGRIARSAELGGAAMLLAGGALVAHAGPAIGMRLMQMFSSSLGSLGEARDAAMAVTQLRVAGQATMGVVGIAGLVLSGTVVAVGAAQARGTFTADPLQPKFDKLNPLTNARQLVGTRPVVELLKACIKVALVGFVTWRVLAVAWPDLMDLGSRDASSLASTLRHYAVRLLVTAGTAYLSLAAADYAWQWWQHRKSLLMTKDEVRQESRNEDGDPTLKSRMRSIARSRSRRQMFADVPKADVVIVNPTHIAIALRYDPLVAPAPVVLAMGERKIAERIKALAATHGVPMIEDRPLARALLASTHVGAVIPAELYAAVAEVLAFVFRQRALKGNLPEWSGTVTR
jgi:flagellar biosynthetic protein FlhB